MSCFLFSRNETIMSHKQDRRIAQSEKAIVEAGIRVLWRNPDAGMSQIANAAGIGRATLYRHFDTREALIRKLARVCMEETESALQPHQHLRGRAALETIIDVLMPMVDRFRFLVSLWHMVEGDEDIRRSDTQMRRDLETLIDQAKKAGEIDASLPTSWLCEFFDNTLNAGWMMIEAGTASSAEAAKFAKQSYFNGCAA